MTIKTKQHSNDLVKLGIINKFCICRSIVSDLNVRQGLDLFSFKKPNNF
jgi:hypothetical protein